LDSDLRKIDGEIALAKRRNHVDREGAGREELELVDDRPEGAARGCSNLRSGLGLDHRGVHPAGCRVRVEVPGSGFGVCGLQVGFRAYGFGFRGLGLGVRV
jgi:hypothetical protein